jgi:hypothetical protein
VLAAIPPNLTSEEWTAALPRALVAGFVKTDKDFQTKGIRNGMSAMPIFIHQKQSISQCQYNVYKSVLHCCL